LFWVSQGKKEKGYNMKREEVKIMNAREQIEEKILWLESMLPVMATEEARRNIEEAIATYKAMLVIF
jgi:hypothetical protein